MEIKVTIGGGNSIRKLILVKYICNINYIINTKLLIIIH